MGITIGAMLEEIQGLYNQHHQSCFLYLSSEVIKVRVLVIKKKNRGILILLYLYDSLYLHSYKLVDVLCRYLGLIRLVQTT